MLGIKPLCVLGVFPTLSSTPAQIDGLCVSVYLHSDKRCMTTVVYLFLFLLRLIKPLTLSKATAVSKSQQLSRRDPVLSGGPWEGRIRTKGGSKSVQCPVHSRAPLPPGGRSMQVFPESWALWRSISTWLFFFFFLINGSFEKQFVKQDFVSKRPQRAELLVA